MLLFSGEELCHVTRKKPSDAKGKKGLQCSIPSARIFLRVRIWPPDGSSPALFFSDASSAVAVSDKMRDVMNEQKL